MYILEIHVRLYNLQQFLNFSLRLFTALLHMGAGIQKDQERNSHDLMKIFVSENLWILIRMLVKKKGFTS